MRQVVMRCSGSTFFECFAVVLIRLEQYLACNNLQQQSLEDPAK